MNNIKFKALYSPEVRKIWKTDAAFFNWLRGNIRRALWTRHPVKVQFIKSVRFQVKNPSKRKGAKATVWGAKCAMCNTTYVMKKLQVDHINPAGSLLSEDDIQPFISNLTLVDFSSLQMLCNGEGTGKCHDIKTHSERYGMSIEQARKEKGVIEFGKLPAKKQNSYLRAKGHNGIDISNETKRKNIFRKLNYSL